MTVCAVVLAAGLGTRLEPLTRLRPKALCPINNEPLLDGAIRRCVGLTDAVAVNGHAHAGQMVEHLAGRDVHVAIEQPRPLGTAGALGNLRGWIDGRAVLVQNADAWHTADLAGFVSGWDGERIRLLGVVSPEHPAELGGYTFAGVSLMPWAAVAGLAAEPSGLWEVLWRAAWDRGEIDLVATDAPWFDCGTPRSYLAANLAASGGASVVGAGARIGAGAAVVRSVVWPDSVVDPGERLVECIRASADITVPAPQ